MKTLRAALELSRSRLRDASISGVHVATRWHQLWRLDRSSVQIQNRCCPHWDAQCANQVREIYMSMASFPSDTIVFKASTGGNSAGNGGDGYNEGNIISNPSIHFNPYNKAEGADVHVNTGDQVHQKADWEAGGANAKADWFSKAYGGTAKSNGDQSSDSGHDTSKV